MLHRKYPHRVVNCEGPLRQYGCVRAGGVLPRPINTSAWRAAAQIAARLIAWQPPTASAMPLCRALSRVTN